MLILAQILHDRAMQPREPNVRSGSLKESIRWTEDHPGGLTVAALAERARRAVSPASRKIDRKLVFFRLMQ